MRHGPADVITFALSKVVAHKEVAKVEDEWDDDTDEGTAGRRQDDVGGEDGRQGVLNVLSYHEPSGQETCIYILKLAITTLIQYKQTHTCDYEVQMLKCRRLTRDTLSVE